MRVGRGRATVRRARGGPEGSHLGLIRIK